MNTIGKRFKLLSDLTQFIGINKGIVNSKNKIKYETNKQKRKQAACLEFLKIQAQSQITKLE
jgi:hypothetical protein